MKKLICLIVIMCPLALSQGPIKKDLFYLFSKVPAPPESGAQAYSRSDRTESGEGGDGSIGKMVAALRAEIKNLRDQIMAASTGGMGDIMTKAQKDPEAMEKMSEEEKMKMAQAMMKSMQTAPREIHESPEVMNAFHLHGELMGFMNNEIATDAQNLQLGLLRWERIQEQFREIDERTNKAILQKYPHAFETGETRMTEAELKAEEVGVRQMRLKAWTSEKIPFLNKELQAVHGDLVKRATQLKSRFAPFNEALKKANYAADATDQGVSQALGSGQGSILSAVEELLGTASTAWDQATSLYAEKVKLDKEKNR